MVHPTRFERVASAFGGGRVIGTFIYFSLLDFGYVVICVDLCRSVSAYFRKYPELKRIRRSSLKIRMMMPVSPFQCVFGHPQKLAGFAPVRALLH